MSEAEGSDRRENAGGRIECVQRGIDALPGVGIVRGDVGERKVDSIVKEKRRRGEMGKAVGTIIRMTGAGGVEWKRGGKKNILHVLLLLFEKARKEKWKFEKFEKVGSG